MRLVYAGSGVAGLALLGLGCSTADELTVTQPIPSSTTTVVPPVPSTNADSVEGPPESDQLPVLDSAGGVVGYMNRDEYYAGTSDPDVIEVYSFEDHTLIGVRVKYVGFVPVQVLEGNGTLEEIVEGLYGEQIEQWVQRNAEIAEFIDSFEPGELARLIDEQDS